MSRCRVSLAGLVLLVPLAACSGGATPSTADADPGGTTASPPRCDEAMRAGAVIPADLHRTGCVRRPDELYVPGTSECTNGRRMLSENGLYGYLGEVAKPAVDDDPAFAAFVAACHG